MQNEKRSDITTSADIDHLVTEFYVHVLADPIIGFLFTEIAKVDLPKHLPKISAFWQQQLLGKLVYRGEMFAGIGRGARTPLAPLLRKQITMRRVSGEHYHGRWRDIGTPERLVALNRELAAH